MKKVFYAFSSLLLVTALASCGSSNKKDSLEEKYHVHEMNESKTVHYDANCLFDEVDEYHCACGELLGYSADFGYDFDSYGHDFKNGVCRDCGIEESDFEIRVLSPKECAITYYNGDSLDIVIPDEIYGLKVTGIHLLNGLSSQYQDRDRVLDYINSLTFGENIKFFDSVGYVYDNSDYYVTPINEVIYTSTINDFVNIKFGNSVLESAAKASINGEDIKNLVLPDDIDLTNSKNTFSGTYIESITLPDNLNTMGKNTFDVEKMNPNVFTVDQQGNGYIKSKTNDKYMLAYFGNRDAQITMNTNFELTIDSNVKMIYGPAWLYCKYNKIIIGDNVKYFTDIIDENSLLYISESILDGYHLFTGDIEYTGTLKDWLNKEFLRYTNVDFKDRYTCTDNYIGDIRDIHNPISLALNFSCSDATIKESKNNTYSNIELTIPEGVTKTNQFALENCKFTKINLPKSLKTIGTKSIGCLNDYNLNKENSEFASVNYEGKLKDWLDIDFESFLANPFINESEISYDYNLYLNNKLLTNLVMPNGVKEIKTAQFAGVNSIISIDFNDVKYIGDFAFSRCTNIYNYYIAHNTLKNIEGVNIDKLKQNAPNQKFDLVIPKSVKYIGMCSFETYGGAIVVYIPKEVEYVSTYAFCVGRTPTYYGSCVEPYIFTNRDNTNDGKWNFVQKQDGLYNAFYIASYSAQTELTNIEIDDIVVKDFIYYKKNKDNTLIFIALHGSTNGSGFIDVYSNGSIVVTIQNTPLYTVLTGVTIDNVNYKVHYGDYYVLYRKISYALQIYRMYISKDVASVSFGNYYLGSSKIYFEGTEEEWNAICDNPNIKPTYYNCTLVQN